MMGMKPLAFSAQVIPSIFYIPIACIIAVLIILSSRATRGVIVNFIIRLPLPSCSLPTTSQGSQNRSLAQQLQFPPQ